MRTIAIIGSRRRDDLETHQAVAHAFARLFRPGDRIVSGGAKQGADRLAPLLARKVGTTLIVHYPCWKKYGRIATFMRNTQVANEATHMIAAVHPSRTGGTEDTIQKFLRRRHKRYLKLV